MPLTVAQLQVKVGADTEDAKKNLDEVGKKADDTGFSFKKLAEVAGGVFAGGAILAGFGFLKDQLTEAVTAGEDFQKTQAQTAAVLTSTGDASGQTAQSINDLADSLSRSTTFSADATQQAENMLLTFTGISGKTFPEATKTTLDFATAMHMDATSAALDLGKALNDPATGMTKLQREGVTFTEQQKEQIKQMEKSGNVAGAQAIILQELQKEFGGSAQAAGGTFGGALEILNNQFEIMKEKVGAAIIPILAKLMSAIAPVVGALADGLAGALTSVSSLLTSRILPAFQPFFDMLPTLFTYARNIGEAFLRGVAPAFTAVSAALSGLMPSGKGANSILQTIHDTMRDATPIAYALGKTIGEAITAATPIVQQLATVFTQDVLPAAQSLIGFVVTSVLPGVMQLAGFVGKTVVPILGTLADVFAKDILPAAEQVASTIINQMLPPLEHILSDVLPVLNPLLQALGWVLGNVVGPGLAGVASIAAGLLTALSGILDFLGKIKDIAGGILGGIGDALGLGGGGSKPAPAHHAAGTLDAPGGLSIVGEAGPELVNLPSGSQVIPLARGFGAAPNPAGGATGAPMNLQLIVDGRVLGEIAAKYVPGAVRAATGVNGF